MSKGVRTLAPWEKDFLKPEAKDLHILMAQIWMAMLLSASSFFRKEIRW